MLLLVRLAGLLLVALIAGVRFSTAAEPTDSVRVTNDETPTTVIHVGVPRTGEHVLIDGPAKLYEPAGLEPLRTYELRVSFVSTRSAQIHLGLVGMKHSTLSRRLLHAEKLIFSTDESGHVRGVGAGCRLEMWVTSWGRMRVATDRDFFYDVILERNVLGVPVSGAPLLAYALFVVCVVVAWGCLMPNNDLSGVFPTSRSKEGASRGR